MKRDPEIAGTVLGVTSPSTITFCLRLGFEAGGGKKGKKNNKRRRMSDFTQERTCSPRLCTNFATQALSFVQRSVCVCIFKHICITQQHLLRGSVKLRHQCWRPPWSWVGFGSCLTLGPVHNIFLKWLENWRSRDDYLSINCMLGCDQIFSLILTAVAFYTVHSKGKKGPEWCHNINQTKLYRIKCTKYFCKMDCEFLWGHDPFFFLFLNLQSNINLWNLRFQPCSVWKWQAK